MKIINEKLSKKIVKYIAYFCTTNKRAFDSFAMY